MKPEIARLDGLRFVVSSEINPSDRFDEAKVKLLTGGDQLTARRMREDHYDFRPTHKLFLMGNHQPRVSAGGPSFWRRLRLIGFTNQVRKEDMIDNLTDLLIEEKKARHPPMGSRRRGEHAHKRVTRTRLSYRS